MKVSQHTPGPWRADEFYCGYVWSGDKMVADFPMDEDEGTYIARMRGVGRGASREEQHANARLIAAAPEMLAALSWIVEFCDEHPEWTERELCNDNDNSAEAWWLAAARAAIAKAKGESA